MRNFTLMFAVLFVAVEAKAAVSGLAACTQSGGTWGVEGGESDLHCSCRGPALVNELGAGCVRGGDGRDVCVSFQDCVPSDENIGEGEQNHEPARGEGEDRRGLSDAATEGQGGGEGGVEGSEEGEDDKGDVRSPEVAPSTDTGREDRQGDLAVEEDDGGGAEANGGQGEEREGQGYKDFKQRCEKAGGEVVVVSHGMEEDWHCLTAGTRVHAFGQFFRLDNNLVRSQGFVLGAGGAWAFGREFEIAARAGLLFAGSDKGAGLATSGEVSWLPFSLWSGQLGGTLGAFHDRVGCFDWYKAEVLNTGPSVGLAFRLWKERLRVDGVYTPGYLEHKEQADWNWNSWLVRASISYP